MTILEVCVDTIDGVQSAMTGGAARVELCSSLSEGGLTPSAGLMQAAAKLPIPCYAMIRPRSGLFSFSVTEVEIMVADIMATREAGLAGVVLGAQAKDGALDLAVLKKLVLAAGDLGKTLHRVIDVTPDPLTATEQAIDLGFERVLTSGAEPVAPDGLALIRAMVGLADGRLSIMPGCGLTSENVRHVVEDTGVSEIHAACQTPAPGDPAFSDFDPPGGRSVTSPNAVQRMVAALSH